MNRLTFAAIGMCVALTGCGSVAGNLDASSSQPQTSALLQSDCWIPNAASAYAIKFTNPGSQAIEITGFSVVFLASGQETGSDDEPGNGTINGDNTIGMSDWILPGQSVMYGVQLDNMPAADSCELVQWSNGQ